MDEGPTEKQIGKSPTEGETESLAVISDPEGQNVSLETLSCPLCPFASEKLTQLEAHMEEKHFTEVKIKAIYFHYFDDYMMMNDRLPMMIKNAQCAHKCSKMPCSFNCTLNKSMMLTVSHLPKYSAICIQP